MENWNLDMFEPHIGSRFIISADDVGSIETELVEVKPTENEMVQSISLLFRGPHQPVLPHKTNRIRHRDMGEFELFIGPVVSHRQDGIYYEAVLSRLIE